MKLLPIVFAFAVAAVIVWRWARLGWPVKLAGAAVSAAVALYGAGVFHLPELEKVVASVGSTLGPYTYALVAVMAFLESKIPLTRIVEIVQMIVDEHEPASVVSIVNIERTDRWARQRAAEIIEER